MPRAHPFAQQALRLGAAMVRLSVVPLGRITGLWGAAPICYTKGGFDPELRALPSMLLSAMVILARIPGTHDAQNMGGEEFGQAPEAAEGRKAHLATCHRSQAVDTRPFNLLLCISNSTTPFGHFNSVSVMA